MNKHINWKRFDWNNYLVKLFDNPFGRWYLGVPKNKKIARITQSSVHYYTGEIAKNGLPIICTGDCFAGGSQKIFNKIIGLAKVVSCFTFLPIMPKILLPLIVLTNTPDTFPGTVSPGAYWSNANNVKAEDGNFAEWYMASGNIEDLYTTNYGFSIPAGSTINGVTVKIKGKVSSGTYNIFANAYASWKSCTLTTTNTEYTLGSSSELWGGIDLALVNSSSFGPRLECVQRGIRYYVDCVKVAIYYTAVSAPTVTTQSADQIATTSIRGNGNITDTGGANCTRRGFCYKAGTSGDPTTSDSVAYDDGDYGTGAFTKSITGLTPGTSYRVRAYAVNSAGTSYGTTVDVKTLSSFIPRTMWFN